MKLHGAGNYHIGLDLGTGSVGWCVIDDNGDICHVGKKPAWGSRLFPSADTAADRRMKRGQRRRYDRRRQRLDCLQSLFEDEMDEVDPEFFTRLRQSSLLAEDRDPEHPTEYHHPFFNGTDFTEAEYYEKYPTIYHLREHLMESDEKADIRLVYLALHNIVKYRGNFLHEGEENLKAENANAQSAAQGLKDALEEYVELVGAEKGLSCDVDCESLEGALERRGIGKRDRSKLVKSSLNLSDKDMAKNIGNACSGAKAEFSKVFAGLEEQEGTNFALSNDDAVEGFLALCPDDALPLFEAMQAAYSASVLSELLRGEKSLSASMVASYNQHKADLHLLKGLTREHLGKGAYDELFRGHTDERGEYDYNKLPKGSYTAYIAGEALANKRGCSQEDLVKNVRKLFDGSEQLKGDRLVETATAYLENPTEESERNVEIIVEAARDAAGKDLSEREIAEGFEGRLHSDNGEFLAKQKTRANGAIPYQLHKEELDRIIDKQGVWYPFLEENRGLLEKLVGSRIPYYVGPLNAGHDPAKKGYPDNPVDSEDGEGNGQRKFAWSVRKLGMEDVEAHPWNVDEVIDKDATAERFIRRMTGTCTYLWGEPVLPRCSLLYEEFCVLNELNGSRWGEDGHDPERFDAKDRKDMVEKLFKRRKTVSRRAAKEWLERRHGAAEARVVGTQGETGYTSKLSTYNDFRAILGVDRLEDPNCPLTVDDVEQIVLWNTVFEDRDILKRKLVQAYGDILTPEQINKIVRKRYTGWGRLSRKFLCELKTDTPQGRKSIMDVLREGDPTTGRHCRAMTLMETLHDDDLGFETLVDDENKKKFGEEGNELAINDLPGSPALRRSVNQALRIVDEIVGVAGRDPASIAIEVTRDEDEKKKGVRTTSRHDQLKRALEAFEEDVGEFDPGLLKELDDRKGQLADDRLMLYFAQCGKCMYTGEELDIDNLSEYHVDHVIPQAYIKDDSLDNRVLVKRELNERKLDSLLLPDDVVRKQRRWWRQLHEAKLISDKKYRNLTRERISDESLKGFINRQLVETSQIVKFTRQQCEQKYKGTQVISLRASLSHGLRERCKFAKCRELNDFHHAHDAYLACQMARFIGYRYPKWQDDSELTSSIVREHVRKLGEQGTKTRRWDTGSSGFFVDSFMRSGFDKDTGEITKDEWDADSEVARMGRTLDMKQCFITRMPEEQTGAFWDETLYSPRDAKHHPEVLMPAKGYGTEGALDPAKYGGFDNPRPAHFFIFRAYDEKGKVKYFFESVPIHLLAKVTKDDQALTEYAESIAEGKGCSGAQVLRKKVLKQQKLELDGAEYWLGGRSGKSNYILPSAEPAGDRGVSKLANKALEHPRETSDEEYLQLYEFIRSRLKRNCPKLAAVLDLDARIETFRELSADEKSKLISNLLSVSNGKSANCDISAIGGSEHSGQRQIVIASCLSRITWIDQSVTGIYEKRTTLADMEHGL